MSSLKRKAKEGIGFLSLAFGITVITTPLAWFTTGTDLNPQVSASSKNAYFAAGDGTAARPFELTSAIHYYNLCWLQYLGRFNQISGATVKQVYFQLDNDIDLTHISASDTRALLLPPIGTSRYPFIGNFNGQGHTLTNLSVTNSATLSDYPIHPYLSDGVKNLECLGVFGVAGTTESTSTVNGLTTFGKDESHTYDPAVNIIKDLNLTNISVKATTNQTLIGIGVGYNNATLEHIGVGTGCKLNVSSSTSATNYTSNLSDSALVGYTAKKEDTSLREDEAYVPYVDNPNNAQGGSAFGSSIDMKTMYSFLNTVRTNSTNYNYVSSETRHYDPTSATGAYSVTNQKTTEYLNAVDSERPFNIGHVDSYTDEDGKKYSSFSIAKRTTTGMNNYIYLYGDLDVTVANGKAVTRYAKNYVLKNTEGKYLTLKVKKNWFSKVYTLNFGTADTATSAASLYLDPSTGMLSYTDSTYSQTFYFYYDNTGTISYSQSQPSSYFSWTKEANSLKESDVSGYYLSVSSSGVLEATTNSTSAATTSDAGIQESTFQEDSTFRTAPTYFPLSMDGHLSMDDKGNTTIDTTNYGDGTPYFKNTGYVVGGAKTYSTDSSGHGLGNIRVSKYDMSNLNNSFGSDSYSDSQTQIVTRNYVPQLDGSYLDSDWSLIKDKHNNQGTSDIPKALSDRFGSTRMNYKTDLHLMRYASARDDLATTFTSDSSNVYGLHFMQDAINIHNCTTIEHAEVLDGKTTKTLASGAKTTVTSTFYNLKVPRNSIDFNLMQPGYISFFAGSYFPGNTSFFSLFHITRNADNTIASIDKLGNIYTSANPTDDEPYAYSNPDSSQKKIFDCSWIEGQLKTDGKWVDNALYYFEIPVNKGEYALGSYSGANGAYLIYLDIGASTNYKKVTVKEKIYTQLKKASFVTGIDFLVDPTKLSSVTGGQTANVAITSASSAIYSFTPTADGLTIDQPSTSLSLEYGKSGYPVTASDTALSYSSSKNTYNMTEEKTTTIQYNGSGTETRTTEVTFTLKDATSGTTILLPSPIKTRDNTKDSITYTLNNDAVYAVDSSSASYATIDSTAKTITLSADAPSTGVIFTLKYSEVSTEWQDKWYGPHNDELNKDSFSTSMVKYHFTDTTTDSKNNATVNYQYSYVRTDDSDEGGTFTYYLTVNSPLATTLVIDSLPPTSSTFTYQVILFDGTTATTVSTVGQTISIAAAA